LIAGIVWTMVPLASATALGIIGGTISLSLLCIWWLLRAERQETDEEEAAERAEAEAARPAVKDELNPRSGSRTT
jgi:type VI protein secretion system component VasK